MPETRIQPKETGLDDTIAKVIKFLLIAAAVCAVGSVVLVVVFFVGSICFFNSLFKMKL